MVHFSGWDGPKAVQLCCWLWLSCISQEHHQRHQGCSTLEPRVVHLLCWCRLPLTSKAALPTPQLIHLWSHPAAVMASSRPTLQHKQQAVPHPVGSGHGHPADSALPDTYHHTQRHRLHEEVLSPRPCCCQAKTPTTCCTAPVNSRNMCKSCLPGHATL